MTLLLYSLCLPLFPIIASAFPCSSNAFLPIKIALYNDRSMMLDCTYPNCQQNNTTFIMQTYPRSFTTRQRGYEYNIEILDCSYAYGLFCPVGTVDANEPNLPFNEKLCCKNMHSKYTHENVVILNTNQEIAGGAVMFKGRIIGYDYISSVYKLSTNRGNIYQVQTRRLNCLTHETRNSKKVAENQAHAVQTYYPVNRYNGEAAPAYYPVNGGARCKRQLGGTCPSQLFCFSDDMEIETWDGTKKMVDLKLGDYAKAYSTYNKYDPVLSFLHRLPEQEAEFLQFNLTNDKILKITPNHLIYKVNCDQEYSNEDINKLKAVPSQTIHPNDCLLSWSELMQKLNGLLNYLSWNTEENSINEIDIPFSTQILYEISRVVVPDQKLFF